MNFDAKLIPPLFVDTASPYAPADSIPTLPNLFKKNRQDVFYQYLEYCSRQTIDKTKQTD